MRCWSWMGMVLLFPSVLAADPELFEPIDVELSVLQQLEQARRQPGYQPIDNDQPSPFELLEGKDSYTPPTEYELLPPSSTEPDAATSQLTKRPPGRTSRPPSTTVRRRSAEVERFDNGAEEEFQDGLEEERLREQTGIARIEEITRTNTSSPVEGANVYVPMPSKTIVIRGIGEVEKLQREFDSARQPSQEKGPE